MAPLPDNGIWTPDVIATVVYRVVMIMVSLAFLWRAYRRPSHHVEDGLLLDVPLRNMKHEGESSVKSSTGSKSPFKSMVQDFIAAQVDAVVHSSLGNPDDGKDMLPAVLLTSKSSSASDGSSRPDHTGVRDIEQRRGHEHAYPSMNPS